MLTHPPCGPVKNKPPQATQYKHGRRPPILPLLPRTPSVTAQMHRPPDAGTEHPGANTPRDARARMHACAHTGTGVHARTCTYANTTRVLSSSRSRLGFRLGSIYNRFTTLSGKSHTTSCDGNTLAAAKGWVSSGQLYCRRPELVSKAGTSRATHVVINLRYGMQVRGTGGQVSVKQPCSLNGWAGTGAEGRESHSLRPFTEPCAACPVGDILECPQDWL